MLEAPHVFVEALSIDSITRDARALRDDESPDAPGAATTRHVDEAFHGWNDVWLDPEFKEWNIEASLPRVSCPVLVLQGVERRVRHAAQVAAIHQHAGGKSPRA